MRQTGPKFQFSWESVTYRPLKLASKSGVFRMRKRRPAHYAKGEIRSVLCGMHEYVDQASRPHTSPGPHAAVPRLR